MQEMVMPYLSVETNADVADEPTLLAGLSQVVAEMLGKPESYVMVHLESNARMLFAGSAAPAAYVQLKSLGLPAERTADYSATLCAFLGSSLGIDAARIYIEFSAPERHMWGWNNATF